jgi:hypothetical protein
VGPWATLFSPLGLAEALALEEGVGDHGHQCVAMEPMPGSALEVVETELFLHLLMRLFAEPARLDGGSEGLQER